MAPLKVYFLLEMVIFHSIARLVYQRVYVYIYINFIYIYICMLDQELFEKSYQRSFFAESVQMVRTRLVT